MSTILHSILGEKEIPIPVVKGQFVNCKFRDGLTYVGQIVDVWDSNGQSHARIAPMQIPVEAHLGRA